VRFTLPQRLFRPPAFSNIDGHLQYQQSAVMIAEGTTGPVLGMFGPFPLLTVIASLAALLAAIILNLNGTGRERLAAARLSLGKNYRYYLLIPVIFSLLYIGALVISHVLGLSLPRQEYSISLFTSFLGLTVASVVITWPQYFGEEYGWRYYLQDRMFSLRGRTQGVLLVGLIWGLWHLPLMLMGLNFSGDPVTGILIYLVYTIIMSVIFGFAVLATESVWIAVILHALTDSIVNTGYSYIADGNIPVAFIPVIVLLGIFALALLRSGTWRNETASG
jgi:membrane protease YdiL (CAAX protease family)